ncbi:TonB-dependent receptor [Pontibacter korlensis]|uniref:TonB-dependent receptor plug domain-containing protein n=1 Tax=Pontibacter korlensis TaxID=400092 RepID=A0A0E3ZDA2_9BACT|nr:TonB-dependent receptor [Pontibacter korlensis]AKD03084.1 hypothetical protein PKOR_08075 [Pontibacter korlensis]
MKKLLLLSFILVVTLLQQAVAQGKTVSGTVTDAQSGQGLPGVTVLVKGTQVGTATGANGNYTINVPEGSNTLVFSFIGYTAVERQVGNASTVNVGLSVDNKQLSEVIITGYGTTNTLVNTGAVNQVTPEDIDIPVTSFDKALQGKVPGLQSVGASGQPGSAQEIRIRGVGSITASSSPLYVIDGVPINSGDLSRNTTTANALAGINPNDIESITVLKDASAASIYGSRAANGVIVVTTKSGKAGKTRVRLNAEYGWSERAYNNENTRPLTTAENIELFSEALLNDSYYRNGYGLTPDNIGEFLSDNFGLDPAVNTNWEDEISQTGVTQQYNVAADGGNDKTRFHVSAGYFGQEGIVQKSEFERYTTNFKLSHDLSNKLTFSSNLMISSSNQSGPLNSGYFANPVMASLFLLPSIAADDRPRAPFNPVVLRDLDQNNNNTLKGIGSFTGEYRILPNLKVTSKYGIDYNNLEEDSYQNPIYGDGMSAGGYSTRYYTRYFNWIWTNLVDYTWDINKDNTWVANLKGGYEAQKSTYLSSSLTSNNLPLNTDYTVPSVGAIPYEAGGTNESYTFASLLAIADFSYQSKYVLSASFRRDGSSRFGSENRYGNFWSVGASWNLDQESFIQDIDWVDQLKLRASYGVNGNAGIGNFSWRRLYGYSYTYDGQVASVPNSLGNEELTWEKNKPFDVGIDAAFFNNRLSITADYYSRETSDLLLERPLSRTTGWTTRLENVGAMRNSGFEFGINATPVQAGDFRWDVNFNISKNKNEVLELVQDEQLVSPFIRKVGEDIQSYYLPLWAGIDPADGNPMWYTDGTRSETTKNYNLAERALTGKKASPDAFGGFGTTVSWKGLALDASFYYSYGNYLYDPYYQYLNSGGYYLGYYNQRATQLNRWQSPENPGDGRIPRLDWDGTNAHRLSDNILNKGDFIRLRDVTLAYNLPESIISKVGMSNVRVYVRGTNLWTSTKDDYLPYDPEAGGVGGTTNFDINVPKTVTFGLNVGF